MKARHNKLLLTGTSAIAFAVIAMSAQAQNQNQPQTQATDSDTTEVVIRGFRGSLQSAINAKKRESGVVDVIKAEDIAAFPDLNLAEALQRIPGVAITREAGEGRGISVRGLGPEYTRVRLNGIEALATSGSSDTGGASGTNRGRGFDFNIFASELFNSLTVRKSASAEVEEGSLGATVDLQTARPFDYNKPAFVVSTQMGYNDLSKASDPRIAVLASRTWHDGKLGALFSVAYSKRQIRQDGFATTRWDTGASQGGFCSPNGYDVNLTLPGIQTNPLTGGANCGVGGPARLPATTDTIADFNLANSATTFLPRIPSYNKVMQAGTRLGLTGSFQARPTDRTLLTLDVLYAKLDTDSHERTLQAIGLSRNAAALGKSQTTIRAFTVDGNNNLLTATMDNVDLRSQARALSQGTEFQQITFAASHRFTDKLKVSTLIGGSSSNFVTSNDTTITFDSANVQNYQIDFSANNRTPNITFNLDPTKPASWSANSGTSEVRLRPGHVKSDFSTAKFDVEYAFSPNLTLKIGLDDRTSNYETVESRRASETAIITLTPQQISDYSQLTTGFGAGLDQPSGVATSWLSPDIDKYAAGQGIYSNTGIWAISSSGNSSARGNTNFVKEDNHGVYGQLDFHVDAFSIPLRGNVGVRQVKTDQRSSGYAAVGSVVQLVTAERSYSNTLPSLNIAADITDKFVVRLASATTIARPGLGNISPGGDVSVQGANRTFSSGNPLLNPTKTDNLDLSFEWYPQKASLYGVGLFQKKFSSFAQTLRTSAIYNTLGLPDSLLIGTTASPTDDFSVTQPVNSPGGTLTGLELNIQQPLTFLPGFWSSLGVIFNYTYVDSKIAYLTSSTPGMPMIDATLVGLSKNAANATLYYEQGAFSIRGSAAYRAGYLTQVPGRNNNGIEGTNSTLNFDARASYKINSRLEVSIVGINLTNEPDDQYVDFSNRVSAYRVTGRQYYMGLRYTY